MTRRAATTAAEAGRRARILLALLSEAPDKMARNDLDSARVMLFRRDARADLWLIGPADGAQLHLTVRGDTGPAALAELRACVDLIWPEGV